MNIIEHKQLKIDEELINLCARIYAEGKTDEEWAQIESCDMFQSQKYCGGYDASEQSFWFSYYDSSRKEWWFEIVLETLNPIIKRELQYLELYDPNN